ncbi:unnamed protein product, partial [Echinostoma caproni]|uniref:Cu2_monoox_C domain-containing protein n=1 Tax=Echinostoma caproni TaxID=27848 RepID=A0A183AHH5_9TREM
AAVEKGTPNHHRFAIANQLTEIPLFPQITSVVVPRVEFVYIKFIFVVKVSGSASNAIPQCNTTYYPLYGYLTRADIDLTKGINSGFPTIGKQIPSRHSRVDSSGIRFYVTDQLRPYDAGVMELGLVYSARSAIPPGQSRFDLRGYCDGQCTRLSFPPEGIVVFASQLHTHQTGTKVVTYHMRGSERLKDLHRDNHYSPHFQEIRLIDELTRVKPGDTLITQCTHDTTKKTHVLFGGLSKVNEMCLNYIFYYPKTELELCKSELITPNSMRKIIFHFTFIFTSFYLVYKGVIFRKREATNQVAVIQHTQMGKVRWWWWWWWESNTRPPG